MGANISTLEAGHLASNGCPNYNVYRIAINQSHPVPPQATLAPNPKVTIGTGYGDNGKRLEGVNGTESS